MNFSFSFFSVVSLASIGEGTRRYIVGQFSQFGTTIV